MPEGLLPPRLVDSLSLTDEQKTKLKDIETAFFKEREEWRTANKETMTEMQKLGAEANAARKAGDNAKLEEINKKMQDLRAPVVELRRKYVDQVRATLTDEQKQKLATALEQMQQHRGGPHPATDAKPTTAPPTPKPAE
jgi:Spy/CpxP family protein refolding chaperone